MENFMKDIVLDRMAGQLECQLEKNGEFKKCKKRFLLLFDKLQKKFDGNKKKADYWISLIKQWGITLAGMEKQHTVLDFMMAWI